MDMKINNTYKCEICNTEYDFINNEEWNNIKAREEYEKNFPNSKWEDRVVVCIDCWNKITPIGPSKNR